MKEAQTTKPTRAVRSKKESTAISSYLAALHNYPQLKHEEVVELFKTLEQGGAKAKLARNRLIECNLRLVVSIAKQYSGHNMPIEDLIQEGNIGLMKSITRFEWRKGFRFSTYATWWIKQAIGQHVLKRKRIIRLPAHAASAQRKMIQAAEEYRDQFGSEPSTEELADLIGASETVIKATFHSGRGVISLQQPSSPSGDDENSLENRLVDDRSGCNPFENVAEKELLEITRTVLAKLTPKESAILRLRFGLVEDETDSNSYPITDVEIEALMKGKDLK